MGYRVFAFVISWFVASCSYALTEESLYKLEGSVYQVASAFYVVTIESGDKDAVRVLESSTEQLKEKLGALDSSDSEELASQIENLQDVMVEFERLAQSNDIAETGYTDIYVIIDFNRNRDLLAAGLKEIRTSLQNDSLLNSKSREYLDLSVRMEEMTMAYLGHVSAADVGKIMYTGESVYQIDQMALDFGKRLRKAANDAEPDDESYAPMKRASDTWRFIEQSFVSYLENSVPDIVGRFNRRIVSSLKVAADAAG